MQVFSLNNSIMFERTFALPTRYISCLAQENIGKRNYGNTFNSQCQDVLGSFLERMNILNNLKKLTVSGFALSVVLLSACTAKHIAPADRDTTGTYDGRWIASVGAPKADSVAMPRNFIMQCSWEPYEFQMTVNDGKLEMDGLEKESVVSNKGNFRFDWASGSVRQTNGIISGNGNEIIGIYSGNLATEEPSGEFVQNIPALGGNACRANISLRRDVS